MRRSFVVYSFILGFMLALWSVNPGHVLAGVLTGETPGMSQSLRVKTVELLPAVRGDEKSPEIEALEETMANLKKQMKRLEEHIDRALSRPDLDPVQRKALLVARGLVQKMVEMLNIISRQLKPKTGPESKKI